MAKEQFRKYLLERQIDVKRQRPLSWKGSIFNMVYSLAMGDTTTDGDQYRQCYDLAPRFQKLATNLQDLREDALWSDIGAIPPPLDEDIEHILADLDTSAR